MATFNSVTLIGRCTHDPETAAGGKLTKIRFAVSNSRKDKNSGQWIDDPMYIDCNVWNRGENGKQADHAKERARKGAQLLISGKLKLETWDDKTTGAKRSKHTIEVDVVQFLDGKPAATATPEPATEPSAMAADAGGDVPF